MATKKPKKRKLLLLGRSREWEENLGTVNRCLEGGCQPIEGEKGRGKGEEKCEGLTAS
jgi:hypothetical protein